MKITVRAIGLHRWRLGLPEQLTQAVMQRPELDREAVIREYVTAFGASHAEQLACMTELVLDTGGTVLYAHAAPDVHTTERDADTQFFCVSYEVQVQFEWLQPIEQFVTLAQLNGLTVTQTG